MKERNTEALQISIQGDDRLPTLIYLPGLHGDWTLVGSFAVAVAGRLRLVKFIYPRTVDWSLDEYAQAISSALRNHRISHGWLLAESFGSQVAWPLCRASMADAHLHGLPDGFTVEGLILAGGFVRHPTPWGVRGMRHLCHWTPAACMRGLFNFYALYARFRHRHAPETLASIPEFVARRTEPDRQAAVHRLDLIARNDPRPIARHVRCPVYYLAGLVDPLVPWFFVRAWLRRNCSNYRGGKTLWRADHNVLGTAPVAAAEQILSWMGRSV